MKKFILPAVALLMLTSCNDFINKEPLDFGNESNYYLSASDLRLAANDFYSMLPKNNDLWGGIFTQDVNSDNQVSSGTPNILYQGDKRTPTMDYSQPWWFSNMRGINFFFQKVEENKKILSGEEALINHYIGEAYFFRAYDNYKRYISLGDIPLFRVLLPDDPSVLTEASKRYPRNIVARDIIEDLDSAANRLLDNAPEVGRICRDAALLLKSRVALYEATWERYHANTCFVPGNSKWPGKDTWPDFKWPAGSVEAEINWFLDQAIDAADKVASNRQLNADYISMFNNVGQFPANDEVILARYYLDGTASHSCSAILKSGGGCNVTRALVNSFLMLNGLPIYAENSGYAGDSTSYAELQNRDLRLQKSVRAAGDYITSKIVDGKYQPDTIYYYKPNLWVSGNEKATTGYELDKWVSPIPEQRIQYHTTTAVPIFRAAEAYLNYLEAYYERYGNLGGNCDTYWKALRTRAGVDPNYMATIQATDLSKENDLAVWSRSQEVSTTLYNIRRERRCEYIAEGIRLDDLKRWRSLDMMVNYQPEGINLWGGPIHNMFKSSDLSPDLVSQQSDGDYVMPLRINSTSPVYEGYNFPKAHYLEPIPISEFLLTKLENGKSIIYQNPGWPTDADGTAFYNGYDYD